MAMNLRNWRVRRRSRARRGIAFASRGPSARLVETRRVRFMLAASYPLDCLQPIREPTLAFVVFFLTGTRGALPRGASEKHASGLRAAGKLHRINVDLHRRI